MTERSRRSRRPEAPTAVGGSPTEPPAAGSKPPDEGALSVEGVLDRELAAIHELRRRRGERVAAPRGGDPIARAHEARLLGLSLSGGGIRSATFNLGILQGLARLGLLGRFDYLSVNSGGGYIGGWLGAWIRRRGLAAVVEELGDRAGEPESPPPAAGDGEAPPPEPDRSADESPEAGPVRFLREFSNYLTPRIGAFSADTWTLVATYLRNLLLNLTVLLLLLAVILLSPRLVLLLSRTFDAGDGLLLVGLAVLFLALAVGAIGFSLAKVFSSPDGAEQPWYTRQGWVQALVVLPLFAAAWLGSLWLWYTQAGALARSPEVPGAGGGLSLARWLGDRWSLYHRAGLGDMGHEILAWVFLAALLYFLLWLLPSLVFLFGGRLRRVPRELSSRRLWWAVLLTAPFAGAIGGALLWTLTWISTELEHLLEPEGYQASWHLLHINVWKPPAIVVVFILTAFFQTGLMGRAFPEALRQWWSRLGAWLLIYAVTWTGLFGMAIYGPVVLALFGLGVFSLLSTGWLGSTLGGILVGRRNGGAGEPAAPGPLRRVVVAAAPQVFILGLLAFVSLGVHVLLSPPVASAAPGAAAGAAAESELSPDCNFFWPGDLGASDQSARPSAGRIVECHSERVWKGTTPGATLGFFALFAGAALLLSWRVDINEFSMHLFYRNRLIRAYLGASNEARRPQPFTGFDPRDDLPLAELSPLAGYDGPYPIHNATLNLVGGQELAWQERKGTAFVFTPEATGFQVHGAKGRRLDRRGYRPTAGYRQTAGGVTLGTAMAISGAAASPNMGAGTTPAMAFLLTVFNVRLGWWLGNPRNRATWPRMGPSVGAAALLSELFGHTDEDSRYVYLSDGGHFENLALYELIRRRCRFIVATDAGADPDFTFADLGNAIRKCATDFGVEIDLEPERIRRDPQTGRSAWHCAVGTIRYDRVDPGAAPGKLVYLKASLTGDEPADVQSYATAHALFPHEPTSDQWFSESQFESYRKLGDHIVTAVFDAVDDRPGRLAREVLFVRLQEAWFPPPSRQSGAFSRLTESLGLLLGRLRSEKDLGFLAAQIYPEWPSLAAGVEGAPPSRTWLPATYDELVAGFFFCTNLLQLMEEVYRDLDLETEHDHPDNRGWMNLFKHWSWAGMLRATWAVTASTFGTRFQTFCERRLAMELGRVLVEEHRLGGPGEIPALLSSLGREGRLNFLELELVRSFAESGPGLGDRLLILRLAVADPTAEGGAGEATELRFTFGLALARGPELLYLRVQDHLRKMGLGRRALRHLIREHGLTSVLALPRGSLPAWSREHAGEAEVGKLRELFYSSINELDAAR